MFSSILKSSSENNYLLLTFQLLKWLFAIFDLSIANLPIGQSNDALGFKQSVHFFTDWLIHNSIGFFLVRKQEWKIQNRKLFGFTGKNARVHHCEFNRSTFERRHNMVDQSYQPTRYQSFVNLLKMRPLALPNGFNAEGLPTTPQIVCPTYQEDLALRIGNAYEKATD